MSFGETPEFDEDREPVDRSDTESTAEWLRRNTETFSRRVKGSGILSDESRRDEVRNILRQLGES